MGEISSKRDQYFSNRKARLMRDKSKTDIILIVNKNLFQELKYFHHRNENKNMNIRGIQVDYVMQEQRISLLHDQIFKEECNPNMQLMLNTFNN